MPEEPEDICPETYERHIPDWNTVTIERDGRCMYVDVTCRDCQRSGCVGAVAALADNIAWGGEPC